MKNLFYLLFFVVLITACNKDDEIKPVSPKNDVNSLDSHFDISKPELAGGWSFVRNEIKYNAHHPGGVICAVYVLCQHDYSGYCEYKSYKAEPLNGCTCRWTWYTTINHNFKCYWYGPYINITATTHSWLEDQDCRNITCLGTKCTKVKTNVKYTVAHTWVGNQCSKCGYIR